MKKIVSLLLLSASIVTTVNAQTKKEVAAIKSLCGCYEVEFKYAETFAPSKEYQFKDRYKTGGLEWVVAEEFSDKKMVLQHLLVINDSTVIKHWREDWEYQQNQWLAFDKSATWKKISVPAANVKGQWTQTVWEVDDAPRYQGSAKWVENDGKYYWENTADAPLPRREYTKRNDYNVMKRGNRVIVTDSMWIHEQDNEKVIRKDGAADQLLVLEKGYNIYRKVDDSKCAQAKQWWVSHKPFWNAVRQSWTGILSQQNQIHLQSKVDDKFLYQQLDAIEEKKLDTNVLQQETRAVITKYVQPAENKTASK